MLRVIALLIGYGFGLIQCSYIYGKFHGVDIRTQGSGNAGTTNALRTWGTKVAVLVMLGDILKCFFAILLVRFLFGASHPEMDYLLRYYTGLGAILGHNYPFYMQFKGGKGVACTSGIIFAISVPMSVIGLIMFFGTVFLTHYVSLASLLVGAEFFIGTLVLGFTGQFHTTGAIFAETVVLAAIISGQMFYRHRGNISRLLHGTERKTYLIKPKKANEDQK